jgi:hypothetical protein
MKLREAHPDESIEELHLATGDRRDQTSYLGDQGPGRAMLSNRHG